MGSVVKVETEESGDGIVIRVAGDVDLYSSPELRKAVLAAIPRSKHGAEVDLSGVTYMDSSGVATLVEGLRSAREHDTSFTLISPSDAVMKVLELARLDTVFEVRRR
jgi:anti-sigma B factor antagonist